MRKLRMLGFGLLAVFALSAIASATASAAVEVLNGEHKLLTKQETWKGESGKGTLEGLKGKKVVCQKDTSEGTIEAEKPLGLFHIAFEGCKGEGIAACNSLGDKAEVILSLGTYHFVFDKLGSLEKKELGIGVLFLLEPVHFECLGVLQTVTGEVLCLIKPVDELVKHFEIVCEQVKGDPSETLYWNEGGTEVKMGGEALKSTQNEKEVDMAGELTTALILTVNLIELRG
jgi:hypothetical protein